MGGGGRLFAGGLPSGGHSANILGVQDGVERRGRVGVELWGDDTTGKLCTANCEHMC